MAWLVVLILALVVAGSAIWLRPKVGALTGFAMLYMVFQVGSLHFMIPNTLYKDGGNGTLGDWPVWIVWAAICTGGLMLATLGFKRFCQKV